MISTVLAVSSLLAAATAQQIGTNTAEVHPSLQVSQCTSSGCVTSTQSIVLDANWRWLHNVGGSTNCYTGNTWNTTLCPDAVTCAANCALDGANYSGTYGITTSGNALTLDFVTTSSSGTNVGSRNYLMAAGSTTEYQVLKLLGQEFTFTVDVSNLPCGLNGALYFSQMDGDGGVARFPTNKAGAQYGTGYCDSQCPQDLKFIDGQANSANWTPDSNSANSGLGAYGSCCNELDIWEANEFAAAYTPHPCSVAEQTRCTGTDCGIGARYESLCDADGCDFNSYRQGNTTFYGPGLTIDTTKPIEVVTQFLTDDGTTTGNLVEIRRYYVQNGNIFPNSESEMPGAGGNSITTAYCNSQKAVTGDTNEFAVKGGLATIGAGLEAGFVLVLSVWDDYAVQMLWLDAPYPTTANPANPGVVRGPCSDSSGVPATIEKTNASASVTYSNIKWGAINSTFTGTLVSGLAPPVPSGGASASSSSSTSAAPPSSSTTTTTTTVAPTTTTTRATTTVAPTTTTSAGTCAASTTTVFNTITVTVTSAGPTTTTTTKTTTTTSTTTSSGAGATQTKYGQCAGIGYTGPTVCSGSTCTFSSSYYSQCL